MITLLVLLTSLLKQITLFLFNTIVSSNKSSFVNLTFEFSALATFTVFNYLQCVSHLLDLLSQASYTLPFENSSAQMASNLEQTIHFRFCHIIIQDCDFDLFRPVIIIDKVLEIKHVRIISPSVTCD